MIAISPSKNVSAPINASMIAAKPIQPVHAEDMSRRVSIVLMQHSFLGRRGRGAAGAAQRGSNAQDLLLLGLEFVVREDSLLVQLRQVLKLLCHVGLRRCCLWRRGLLRLVVVRLVVGGVPKGRLAARRAPCRAASHSATWSEHRFLLRSGA